MEAAVSENLKRTPLEDSIFPYLTMVDIREIFLNI